eukprot:gene1041-1128_t
MTDRKISSTSSSQLLGMTSALVDHRDLAALPKLVVFDLDDCLWHPEMYTLSEIPSRTFKGPLGSQGEGVLAVYSGSEQIRLYPDALRILQEYYLNYYPGMRIAAASSADSSTAVRIGRTAMGMLEVLPGVTMRQVFAKDWPTGFEGNLQIGRSPPLSSDKASSHFPILREQTGIAYEDMVFFDDCNWGDHCANVERKCPGVVTQRTPHGIQASEWIKALKAFAQRVSR